MNMPQEIEITEVHDDDLLKETPEKLKKLRWPIKDINFILVLIVFLSLSTAEEMFSPRNYTFHRGKKSFLRGENFIPRNFTFLHGIILFSAELNYPYHMLIVL